MTSTAPDLSRALHNSLNAARVINSETHAALWTQTTALVGHLLERMTPDAKTLRRVISTEDPALLRLLFETQGSQPYVHIQSRHPDQFTFSSLLKAGRHDVLGLLERAGFAAPSPGAPGGKAWTSRLDAAAPGLDGPRQTNPDRAVSALAYAAACHASDDPLRGSYRAAILSAMDAGATFEASACAAFLVRDAELLSLLLQRFPDADWHDISRRKLKISTLAAENRADLIALLYRAGVPVRSDAHHMVGTALLLDDPAMLDFLRRECSHRASFWKVNSFNLAMRNAKPGTAHHLWQDFLALLDNPNHRGIRSFFQFKIHNCRWKELAMFLCAGRDVTRHMKGWETLPDDIQTMVEMTTSHHGRLRLHELEPDPVAALKRPPESSFFGRAAEDVEQRLKSSV